MNRRSFGFLAGSLIGGNLVSAVFQMIGIVLIARLVQPATLGLYSGIALVLGYAPLLQLGVFNGLNRELPYYVGKGDHQRVSDLAAVAQAWAFALGCVVFAVLAGTGGWYLANGEFEKGIGWLAHAILAGLLFYSSYLQMTYRTSQDFARLALAGVVQNSVALVLVATVAILGFYGLCLRALVAAVAGAGVLTLWRPLRVGPKWNAALFKHLLRIGLPIFVVGQVYALWTVLNSTLVLKLAGTEGMGLYTIAVLAGTAAMIIPTAVSQIVYPRMAEQYGRTGSAAGLISVAMKPVLLSAAGLAVAVTGAWFLIEPVVGRIMPAYIDAVPAIQWTMLSAVVSCFGAMNNFFNVVRRQRLYLAAMLVGIAAYGAALSGLVHERVELHAFPQAMLIGQVVFQVVCCIFLYWLRGGGGRLLDREK